MKTLEQCYRKIGQENTRWSYYDDPSIEISGVWESEEKSFGFIRDYFAYAGKSEVFNDTNLQLNEEFIKKRSPHIVSTFLLGIKLAEILEIDIQTRDDFNMNVKYYWFISCLYHDIGYAYENKYSCKWLRSVKENGFKALNEICDIKNIHNREFKTYPKKLIELYLKGRADCQQSQPKLDHGIMGGLLLYDKLRKQFIKAWNKKTENTDSRDSFYCENIDTGKKLHLSKNHYDAYGKVADAVISHNIWKSSLRDFIEGDESITNSQYDVFLNKKINLEHQRLCFILSLADTIEPIKKDFKNLCDISIGTMEQKRGVCLETKKTIYDNIYANIEELETWLDVKVNKKCLDDRVSINIEVL